MWMLSLFPHDLQPVRKGTNGAVTKTGLLAAAAAGSVIGIAFVIIGFFTVKCSKDAALKQLFVIPLSSLAGLCGSVIDSILGATLQFSGFCTVRNKVCQRMFWNILPPLDSAFWYWLMRYSHASFALASKMSGILMLGIAVSNLDLFCVGCWKTRTNCQEDFRS